MKCFYDIVCSVDMAKSSKPVEKTLESINNILATYGVDERVECLGHFVIAELSTGREMTDGELSEVESIIKKEYTTMLEKISAKSGLDISFVGVRRKSSSESNKSEQ
jgi:hypothetical protein